MMDLKVSMPKNIVEIIKTKHQEKLQRQQEVKRTLEINKYMSTMSEMFNDFLDNYKGLTNKFDFKDPADELYFYEQLVHEGYLSKDKTYRYDMNHDYRDTIDEYEVFAGVGVCVHEVLLFNEICEKIGYDAKTLVLDNILQYMPKKEVEHTHHMISTVKYNDEVYYLDPSNGEVMLREDDYFIPVHRRQQKHIISNYDHELNKNAENNFITYPSAVYDYSAKRNNIEKLVEENTDILDSFYNQNKDNYKNIDVLHQKVYQLKNNK